MNYFCIHYPNFFTPGLGLDLGLGFAGWGWGLGCGSEVEIELEVELELQLQLELELEIWTRNPQISVAPGVGDMQRFHGCVLRDKGTLTNKLRSRGNPHHCRQPKGNVPLLDCLTQVAISVRVLTQGATQFVDCLVWI